MKGPDLRATPQLSVAPMLDWTDRHYRHLVRPIAPRTRLYSEMVVAEAILRGDPSRLLGYSAQEHPLAGRIWDVGARAYLSEDELVAKLTAATYVLLGEVHDNREHHRLQAQMLDRLVKAGRKPDRKSVV